MAALAAGCFVAAYALEPLSDDAAAVAASLDRPERTATVAAASPQNDAISPRRDPFAFPARPVVQRHDHDHSETVATIPAVIGPLPPNAGASGMAASDPLTPNGRLRVLAIATGDRPNALVDATSGVRVVEPGDVVDGRRIGRIDASSVEVDGVRVAIDRNDRAPTSIRVAPVAAVSPSTPVRTPPPYAPSLPPAPVAVGPTPSPGGP